MANQRHATPPKVVEPEYPRYHAMPATMLRSSYTISAPTLQRFNAAIPPGDRSRVVEQFMLQAVRQREADLENIATAYMTDPAFAECRADEALWDVTLGDGLGGGLGGGLDWPDRLAAAEAA